MMNDTLLKNKGVNVLVENLGRVEAERFIALIMKEPLDYTKWQRNLFEGMSVKELSRAAMEFR